MTSKEILFRGMGIEGKWHEGNFSELNHDIIYKMLRFKKGSYISNTHGTPFAYYVRPETVGQYTRAKDKNGVKIYEGDIVKNGLSGIWKIESCVGGFECIGLKDNYKDKCYEFSFLNKNVEVIGNLFENPKILNYGQL